MSGGGGLDVRVPIGGLFSVLGVLLVGYGVATGSDTEKYARSLHVNINLWWGLALLAFGMFMLVMARRGRVMGPGGPPVPPAV